MEILALVVWLVVASLALPVGLFTLTQTPVMMVQAMTTGGAAAVTALAVVLGGEQTVLYWIAMGLWLVAILSLSVGVGQVLHSDEPEGAWAEAGAGLAGLEGSFLLVAGVIAIWPALGIGIVT